MGGSNAKVLPQNLTFEEIETAKVLSGYDTERVIRIHGLFLKAMEKERDDLAGDGEKKETIINMDALKPENKEVQKKQLKSHADKISEPPNLDEKEKRSSTTPSHASSSSEEDKKSKIQAGDEAAVYNSLDRLKSGSTVGAKYLMAAIPELDCPLTPRLYRALFGELKKSGRSDSTSTFDGSNTRINFNEAISALMVFNEHTPLDEKMKFFFKIFDHDGDGKIMKKDMEETLAIVMPHETEETIKNNVTKIFEELDVAMDEGIVLDEFSTAVGSLVHQRCTIFF